MNPDLDVENTEKQDQENIKKYGMVNPPSISTLKKDLNNALTYHQTFLTKLDAWELAYEGGKKITAAANESKIRLKLVKQSAEWAYPEITEAFLSEEYLFAAKANSLRDAPIKKQHLKVLNHQFNINIDKVRLIDQISRNLIKKGTCYLQPIWEYQTKRVRKERPVFNYEDATGDVKLSLLYDSVTNRTIALQSLPLDIAMGFKKSNETGILTKATQTDIEVYYEDIPTRNYADVNVLDPRKVILDPTCNGDISTAKFFIYEFKISKSDMLSNKSRYFNIDKATINHSKENPESVIDTKEGTTKELFNYEDASIKQHTAYEYRGYADIHRTGKAEIFIATWVNNTLVRLEVNPIPEIGLNLIQIQYSPDFDNNQGEPEAEFISDNQDIASAIMRGVITSLARQSKSQKGYADNLFSDPLEEEKYLRGENCKFGANQDPNRAIFQPSNDPVSQTALAVLQMQYNDAEAKSGTTSFGGSGVSGDSYGSTAIGIKNVTSASTARKMSVIRRINKGLEKVAINMMIMNSKLLSDEEIANITDEEPLINKSGVNVVNDVIVSVKTKEEKAEQINTLKFILQTNGPKSDPKENQMVRAQIARLHGNYEYAEMIENYEPQPDPHQLEMQALEKELMKVKINNEQAKANENNANGQFDLARVNTEGAKARKLHAEADSIDLNYVEQESGVHQERGKELAILNHRKSN